VYKKSTAIGKPRNILRRAMLDRLLLSAQMTSEGLLKQLSNQPSGVIIDDEIGRIFASNNTRYLLQLKPDLTALYDCRPTSRSLSQDTIRVEQPYLNILGATTPTKFYESVNSTDWEDGFLARWLFALPKGEPDFTASGGLLRAEHLAEVDQLAAVLANIDRQAETDFIFTGNAFDLWNDWQIQVQKDAYYFGDDRITAIAVRYNTYALKFATILAAVNGSWGTITAATMQTAINLVDSYKGYVHRILTEKERYRLTGGKLRKVFDAIRNLANKGQPPTTKQIQQATHLRKHELDPCLEKLVDVGAIVEEPAPPRGKRYIAVAAELPIRTW
jgi:hypothetical protein